MAKKNLEMFDENSPEIIEKVKLFDADSLEPAGLIQMLENSNWEFQDVTDTHMIEVTKNMNIKAVLANLIFFNLVFDIETKPYKK